SFMLAVAINREPKPKRIGIYGLDMTTTMEYALQRIPFKMMIKLAEAEGIRVTAPPQCDILEPTPLYAFKETTPMFWKFKSRQDTWAQRRKEIEQLKELLLAEERYLEGAQQATKYVQNVWIR